MVRLKKSNPRRGDRERSRTTEGGYALLALLAALTITLVMMSAAVPSFKHELQRDQEEELFWRGQQVAVALSKFARLKGRYPSELEELTEPLATPQGDMRLLRPTAICDPMLPCDGKSNWRAVRPGDPLISTFYQAYITEMGRNPERRLLPPTQQLAQLAQLAPGSVTGLNAGGGQQGPSTSEFSSSLRVEAGPIVGVVSQDTRSLIRSYFALPTYDQALFFAGISVSVPGIFNPLVLAPQQDSADGGRGRINDPRCPNGGVYFEQNGKGYCGGVINPGRLCRGPEGTTIPCPPEGQK